MGKVHKMRWRDKDVEEMYRVVKNFNQKVKYHFKNSPNKRSFLPSKASSKDIRDKVHSRKDFKRILNKYKRFSRRGMEEVVTTEGGKTTTKWEVKEAKISARIRNIKIAYQKKKLNIKKPKGYLPSDQEVTAKPLDVDKITTLGEKDFDKFVESTEKRLRDDYLIEGYKAYKENYLKGIQNQLGGDEELLDLVGNIDGKELFEITTLNPKLQIDFVYDDLQEVSTRKRIIKEELKNVKT